MSSLAAAVMSQGPPNLARRIKKQAWAPVWGWFATCAPGLEPLLAREMAALGLEPTVQPGGAEFTGKLAEGYKANLWLRTAGRVLLRLADFRVRTWADLETQAKRIAWEVFLTPGAGLNLRVSLSGSNLQHEGRAGEVVMAAAQERLTGLGMEPPVLAKADEAAQLLMVRGRGRRAQISLDASGGHLHLRGYRHAPHAAPLREDIAAALLMYAGYDGVEPLVDPMAGAGTLGIEAALMARRLPPLQRPPAMSSWPCHRAPTWNHLLATAVQQAQPAAPGEIVLRDIDPVALQAAAANAGRAGVADDLRLELADALEAPSAETRAGRGLVVVNPPYGHRLGSVRQARDLHAKLGAALARAYPGWRLGVVLYRPEWLELMGLSDPRVVTAPMGGLKLSLATGRLPRL